MVNNNGWTALLLACGTGHHECAQALIDAGAAVDKANNYGMTALSDACDQGHHECAQALIDARANVERTDLGGQNALMVACESPDSEDAPSVGQGKAACALALLESMVPIREIVVADQAALLKGACERHQVLEVVLRTSHIIEFAPSALARASVHVSEVHSIIVDFARDMLSQRQLANLTLDGLTIFDEGVAASAER
jgi:hypothetical protein